MKINLVAAATVLTLILGSAASAMGPEEPASSILDRLSVHYDPAALFGTGPEVLAKALAGDTTSVALLAQYFADGDRGFPRDKTVAHELNVEAYRRGHWLASWSLAEDAEAAGDFARAYELYSVHWFAGIAWKLKYAADMPSLGWRDYPDMTHWTFARIQYLIRSGKVSKSEAESINRIAARIAHERGFAPDILAADRCWTEARKFCNSPGVSFAQCGQMSAKCEP